MVSDVETDELTITFTVVTLVGTTSNLLLGRIVLFVSTVVWLVISAFRKTTDKQPFLPSFPFADMKGPEYEHARTIYTKIRGVSFRNPNGTSRQEIIRNCCHPGDALLLMREPDNPMDPDAVGVIRICRGLDGRVTFTEPLGYLSKEISAELAPHFENGPVGFAEIVELTGDLAEQDDRCVGINIRAEIYMPDNESARSHSRKRIA